MTKTTLKIDGMMCGMCEEHVNDAICGAFEVDKVTSSHLSGETVIISKRPLDKAKLDKTVKEAGYTLVGITGEPYTKGGRFSFLKKISDSSLHGTAGIIKTCWNFIQHRFFFFSVANYFNKIKQTN